MVVGKWKIIRNKAKIPSNKELKSIIIRDIAVLKFEGNVINAIND